MDVVACRLVVVDSMVSATRVRLKMRNDERKHNMEYLPLANNELRAQQFAQAIASLPAEKVRAQVFKERCQAAISTVSSSPALLATLTAVAGLAILLVLRPPFVQTIEQDASRPWKSKSSFSWLSAAACIALLVLTVMLVPALCHNK